MNKLINFSFYDLLPSSLKNNDKENEVKNICETLDVIFRKRIIHKIKEVILLDNIDELEEWKVDELAYEYHLDFYKYNLSIEKKRGLVKSFVMGHMKKGTPYALKKVLNVLGGYDLQEWFEYGGDPFYFKVETSDVMQESSYRDIFEAIDTLKNERSWLEALRVFKEKRMPVTIGAVVIEGRELEVESNYVENISENSNVKLLMTAMEGKETLIKSSEIATSIENNNLSNLGILNRTGGIQQIESNLVENIEEATTTEVVGIARTGGTQAVTVTLEDLEDTGVVYTGIGNRIGSKQEITVSLEDLENTGVVYTGICNRTGTIQEINSNYAGNITDKRSTITRFALRTGARQEITANLDNIHVEKIINN